MKGMGYMKNVYIFGTEDYGNKLYEYLKNHNYINILGFIKTKAECGEKKNGLNVLDIENINTIEKDSSILISVADKKNVNLFRAKMFEKGIDDARVLDCSDFITSNLVRNSKKCIICGQAFDSFKAGIIVDSEL